MKMVRLKLKHTTKSSRTITKRTSKELEFKKNHLLVLKCLVLWKRFDCYILVND